MPIIGILIWISEINNIYCWYTSGGDIAYGRLGRIGYIEPEWYHVMTPAILLVLTRYGIPVSTTLLVFSVFASGIVLEKIIVKSALGYGLAAVTAYALWIVIALSLIHISEPTRLLSIAYAGFCL